MVKSNSSLLELSGEPNVTSNMREPLQRASTPGITPFEGGVTLDDSGWVYPHVADSVLIY